MLLGKTESLELQPEEEKEVLIFLQKISNYLQVPEK
jgi:hypothetical protein